MRTNRRKGFYYRYKKINYIENTANATIETDIIATQDTKVELDFEAAENKTNYTFLHGRNVFYIGSGKKDTINYVLIGNTNISNYTKYNKMKRHTYIIGCKYGFSVDGLYLHGGVNGDFVGQKTITFVQGYKGKCYGVKISEGNQLVRHFIPVQRKLDGVVGMYDLVGKKFYTSPNGVAFSGGGKS